MTNVYDVKDVKDVSFTEHLCSTYGWGPELRITQKMLDGGDIEYADTLDCLPRDRTGRLSQNG